MWLTDRSRLSSFIFSPLRPPHSTPPPAHTMSAAAVRRALRLWRPHPTPRSSRTPRRTGQRQRPVPSATPVGPSAAGTAPVTVSQAAPPPVLPHTRHDTSLPSPACADADRVHVDNPAVGTRIYSSSSAGDTPPPHSMTTPRPRRHDGVLARCASQLPFQSPHTPHFGPAFAATLHRNTPPALNDVTPQHAPPPPVDDGPCCVLGGASRP
ncbi:hypothetical protein B0H10DRAFT_2113553 [Mycena sp. CBHHK59/15]|nr:hypothetical protein B0H10DRAFT_2113553 [Mycena sp. CBHHK59/15]